MDACHSNYTLRQPTLDEEAAILIVGPGRAVDDAPAAAARPADVDCNFNLSLDEIEALDDMGVRAQALTFSALDTDDERVRALIRSVDVLEAGDLGVALQRHLLPPEPSAPRRRRKPTQRPIAKAVRLESRGNLFADLAAELLLLDPDDGDAGGVSPEIVSASATAVGAGGTETAAAVNVPSAPAPTPMRVPAPLRALLTSTVLTCLTPAQAPCWIHRVIRG